MQLYKNESKITLTSWIDALGTYLEEIVIDSIYIFSDNNQDNELYLLNNWGLVRKKLKIGEWIEILKTWLDYLVQLKSPTCFFD